MRDTADLVLLTGAADETPGDSGAEADPRSANVAPTDPVRVLVRADGSRRLRQLRWGLVPPWSKDASGAARMINARVETVATKPSYRRAVRTARCAFPADGWYEWQQQEGARTPYLVQRADGRPLWLAGIWARWHPADGGPALTTAAVLTGPAPAELAWLHERAPLAVADRFLDAWLDSDGTDPQPVLDTLVGTGYPPLAWHEVGRGIGRVRDKGAHLMQPLGAVPETAAAVGQATPKPDGDSLLLF
jgi:putative SOS response-associated peptidase YedK